MLVCSFCLCLSVSFFACFFVIAFEYMTLPRFVCALLLLFRLFSVCSCCVCYAIVSAPCSVNAGRQKQQHGQSIAERRQFACLFAFAIGAYYIIMRGHCLQGATPPPAGGTFSVRFDEGKAPNRSCSSPSSLVPRQKTNSWQRDNYRMGIFMTKTLQEHNPQLSCFVLLGYKQLSRK